MTKFDLNSGERKCDIKIEDEKICEKNEKKEVQGHTWIVVEWFPSALVFEVAPT